MVVAKEGLDIQFMEFVVTRELGAVVESHGLAPCFWQRCQDILHRGGDWFSRFGGGSDGNEQSGMPFVKCQNRLAVEPEEHQVGLPMPRCLTVIGFVRPF